MNWLKRWIYFRVVRLNDLTYGRYRWASNLQSRLWVAGWSD